ncbi:MAG TPA: tripartite tricarboxylate transporter substrate binding protein [Noviherbaspirillum sp.]
MQKRPQSELRRRSLIAVALALAGYAPQMVSAQTAQTVKLVVGYAAGGPVDSVARLFATALSKELGSTVIVENRPGASGAIGGAAVAQSAPNGVTLFFAASPTLTITPYVIRKMGFDPVKDLTPIAPVLSYANVLVVNKDQPFKTVPELIAYAKANPGKITYGSAGMGASNHLSGELFAQRTGTQLSHVPYKGNAPAMTDVIGGQITMMFDIIGSARNYISTDRVKALAVTSSNRNASLPDLPSMREAGIADYDVQGWYALFGPANMPADLVARYNDATRRALTQDELKGKLVEQGYDQWLGSPEIVTERLKKELALWGTVTKGMKFE